MNTTLNLNRFGRFFKTEILINKNTIAIILLALLLLMLIVYYLPTAVTTNVGEETSFNIEFGADKVLDLSNYLSVFNFVVFLLPFVLYSRLYDRVKSVRYANLPASQLEKVISAILQTTIIVPILLMAVLVLFLSVIYLLTSPNIAVDYSKFFNDYWGIIQKQSILFLMVFWFKEKKLLKILLVFIVTIILLIIYNYIIAFNSSSATFINNLESFIDFWNKHEKLILGRQLYTILY